jgi:hypothetical protein
VWEAYPAADYRFLLGLDGGLVLNCADCKNITRHKQASQAMYARKHGFSGCALQPAYVYFSRLYERQCADFVRVAG